MQMEEARDRVVLSVRQAKQYNILRSLRPGDLVWGSVRKMTGWGAFIGIDGTYESALLHRSNISKKFFARIEDVFMLGDRVRAVVLGLEEDFTRISLSTADLEPEPGDMLRDKEFVYEKADEQVVHVRRMIEEEEERMMGEARELQGLA